MFFEVYLFIPLFAQLLLYDVSVKATERQQTVAGGVQIPRWLLLRGSKHVVYPHNASTVS